MVIHDNIGIDMVNRPRMIKIVSLKTVCSFVLFFGRVSKNDKYENIRRNIPTGCLVQKVAPIVMPEKNRYLWRCFCKLRIKK